MPTKIIGTAPYQVPRNSDLGTLATQDLDNVNIQGGVVSTNASPTQGYFQNTDVSEIKPSLMLDFANGKALDPRITFSRASTATYYDGSTKAKAEENLFLNSQILQSYWSIANSSILSDSAIAPDGSITADAIVPSAISPLAYQLSPGAGTYTLSVYAKAGTGSSVTLACTVGYQGVAAAFDLSAGTAGAVGSYTSGSQGTITGGAASITSVGNGWYRCVLAGVTIDQARAFHFGPGLTNGTYTGTAYFWGAQLEQRVGASTYVPTTASQITNYVPQLQTAATNVPRFEHDPITGESKGLLIEEQRTNVLPYSQDFSQWVKEDATIRTNVAIAPDGTLTADQLVANTVNTDHSLYQSVGAGTYVLSVYLKADEFKFALIGWNNADNQGAFFDLVNGVVTKNTASGTTATIVPVGNGWFRCIFTYVAANVTYPMICTSADGTTIIHAGTGYGGLYVWGAQLESGAFVTSYIPTGSSAVSRAGEMATLTGSNFTSWYNQLEGTLYAEGYATVGTSVTATFTVGDGGAVNRQSVIVPPQGVQPTIGYNAYAGSAVGIPSASVGAAYSKVAYAYKNGDSAASANGETALLNNTQYPQYVQFNTAHIRNNGSAASNGTVKKIAYYPKRLSNAELQEITL